MDSKGHVLSDKCIADEVPFEIPESWEWVRLNGLGALLTGKTPPSSNSACFGGRIPFVTPGDIGHDSNVGSTDRYLTDGGAAESRLVGPGAIMQVCIGGSIGKTCLVETTSAFNQQINAIEPHLLDMTHYLYIALKSPVFLKALHQFGGGTATPIINKTSWGFLLLPIPPLSEQHRIVERVEELMPLVEEYGRLEDAREKLDAALPDRLRKSVLQMAVQGKLVPQDPADEPASVLLERIREKRSALIKQKKAKLPKGGESVIYVGSDGDHYEKRLDAKGQVLSDECIEDEIPFGVPEGWTWARLPSVADLRIGKTPSRHEPKYWENGDVPWFSISDMHDGATVRSTKESVSSTALRDCFKTGTVPAGTLLMSFKLTIGRTCVAGIDCVHNEAIVSIAPVVDEHDSIRGYLLRILPLISQAGDAKGAIKGVTLNSKSLAALLVPLPPLAEQRRIVKQLEEIYSLIG